MTLALAGTLLISTQAWDPRAAVASWWAKFTTLSDPAPLWETRVGGVPDLAALTASYAIIASRGFVDGYRQVDGEHTWHAEVNWVLPAGDVVVLQQRPKDPDKDTAHGRGYSVVEPANGGVIWGDQAALAVWVYADLILDLVCPDSGDCQVRAHAHRDGGHLLWAAAVPAAARTISGPNPGLTGTRDPAEWFAAVAAGTPGPVPPVIGLTVNGRIQVIDTVAGTRVREFAPPDRQTRVAMANGRLLLSHAEPGSSGCRYWVEAVDAFTLAVQWRRDGYDLGSASGAGCEQRHDPFGTTNRLVAKGNDNIPRLLNVDTGDAVWSGTAGEEILATDGLLLVVAAADRRTVRVIDLIDAQQRAVWTSAQGLGPEAAVTRDQIIVHNKDEGKITVLQHYGSSNPRVVATKATLIGYGLRGVLVASGRRIGFVSILG
jgi:outer membrane protein assembly factor BamB